jgi:Ca-activated chloride channel family protein
MKSRDVNPKDVVFVLDTSGSMAGKKLEQAKKALTFCVENLNDVDRFEIVRFSTESEPLFEKLVDASRGNRDKANDFIKGLKPIGGTAIADALDRALKMKPGGATRPFVVVFLTDGKPTIGETDEERIVAQVAREQGAAARIFCFGIGTDINTHLLDKITERTRAASQFVLPEEDLEVKVSNFFTKIKEPLLTNLRLEFPAGVRVTKLYPNPLPDLFRGDQLVLAGRYSGDGDADVVLDGTLNGQPKRMTQRVKFSARESGNDFIAQLWALRRVGWMLDEIRLRGENRELRDEVVDLARRYAIVTPYTSYLIVEDEARRGVPLAAQTFQRLEGDRDLRRRLAEGYDALGKAKDGYAGAWNARANSYFKNAEQLAAPQEAAKREALGAVAATATPAAGVAGGTEFNMVVKQLEDSEQQTRCIAGKGFAQNGSVWTDTSVQASSNAKRNRVQFASKEYFDLLTNAPECSQWLALGRNVQFTLGDELYEIFE